MGINMKLKDRRIFLLGSAFLILLLSITAISSVAAADDTSQVVCENYINTTILNSEIKNANAMEFNNTVDKIIIENIIKDSFIKNDNVMEFNNSDDKIVIENVIKDVVVISNSTSSVCIVNSTINTIIINNSKIYELTLWNSFIANLTLKNSKIYDLSIWNSIIPKSCFNNSKIYDFTLKNSKFYDLTLRNSITLKASFEKSIIRVLTVSNSTDVIDLAESKSVRPTPIFGSDSDGSNTTVGVVKKRPLVGNSITDDVDSTPGLLFPGRFMRAFIDKITREIVEFLLKFLRRGLHNFVFIR